MTIKEKWRKLTAGGLALTLLSGCQGVNRAYDPPVEAVATTASDEEELEDVVIGRDTARLQSALMEVVAQAQLANDYEEAASANEFISVYYEDLDTGDILSLYPASYYPCSMVKLVCLAAVYDGIREGTIQEDEVKDMLEAMIVISDNTSFNVLAQLAGPERIKKVLKEAGTRKTVVNHGLLPGDAFFEGEPGEPDNTSTPDDLGRILKYIWTYPDEEIRQKMLDLLERCEDDTALVQGLPEDDLVAHKTGWADDLYHDGAIVTEPDGSTYILVVMTENTYLEEFAEVAQTVTDFRSTEVADAD